MKRSRLLVTKHRNLIKHNGLSFSTLLGNINPTNISFVTAYVLDALSPELQAKTSESLQEQINIMQARGVEQTFKPNDIYFDPK